MEKTQCWLLKFQLILDIKPENINVISLVSFWMENF